MNRSQHISAPAPLPSARLGFQEEGACSVRTAREPQAPSSGCFAALVVHITLTPAAQHTGGCYHPQGSPQPRGEGKSGTKGLGLCFFRGAILGDILLHPLEGPQQERAPRLTRRASDAHSLWRPFLLLLWRPLTPGPRSPPQKATCNQDPGLGLRLCFRENLN